MAQKKKKKAQKKACNKTPVQIKQEIAEEILALSSIFADEFLLHPDGVGFRLSVVPHPGSSSENYTSVHLDIRYTAGYPSTPLQLRLGSVVGLSTDDSKLLEQQLQDAAGAFALESSVCVFNLVGMCQEFLLEHNDAAKKTAVDLDAKLQQEQQEQQAAAEAAAGKGCGCSEAEAQSLWHEMQQRMLQQAAQGDAELSTGAGIGTLSSNVLGEDLWMFNAGLFSDEGESAFAVPNLSSPGMTTGSRAKRTCARTALPADNSPDPSSRLKGFGQHLDSPRAASPRTPGHVHRVAQALSRKSPADQVMQGQHGVEAPRSSHGRGAVSETELATAAAATKQDQRQLGPSAGTLPDVQQPPQQNAQPAQQHMQLQSAHGSSRDMQRLLLPQKLNCSFSNLPKGLQRLLGSHSSSSSSSNGSGAKHKQKQQVQDPTAVQRKAAATAVPVFGDFDSSIIKQLVVDESMAPGVPTSSIPGAAKPQAEVAVPGRSLDGEAFQSCISESGASDESDAESDTGSLVTTAHADESGSEEAAEEEGVSLKSQLLTGYLLLLAARVIAGGGQALGGTQISVVAQGLSSDSSSTAGHSARTGVAIPASLLPLADHLRQAGLLPQWVHWLLQQLPQRPELFERAFKRLFQQELEGCNILQLGPMPSAPQVVQQFWNRAAQEAAAAGTVADASSSSHAAAAMQGQLLGHAGATPAPAGDPAVQRGTAGLLSATDAAQPTAQAAVNSRYRSDFQELQALGRGGFGIVVAAINRLDGRKYAVKKIKLQPSGGSSSYARILREVATLSRLQHPNIVRYFQAWTEQASGEGEDFWGESDGGEWGDLGSSDEDSDEDTGDNAYHRRVKAQHSFTETEPSTTVEAVQAAPQSSVSTRWASGTSRTCCSSSDDGDGNTSSSSGGSRHTGVLDQLEFSIPPRLPPPASPIKPQPVPAHKVKKPHKPPGRRQRTRSAAPGQILYIQMEFCPRTLAQVLEAGGLDEADAWMVLRGILAGLAHIHAQGAIHRDLKPANIFYDSKGEIKLGDFGLAKFNTAAAAAGGSSDGTPGDGTGGKSGSPKMSGDLGQRRLSSVGAGVVSATAPSDVTGVCGTGLYISPEIANGWASYNEKVDLYSLGVVVFEMWHPFGTAMERLAVLRELRETGKMPPGWEAAHPQVARLVRWLMSPKPADRPSARQVLQSDLLPPRLEDEQLKDLLRSLPDNPVAYERVIDSLFSIGSSKEQEQQKLTNGHQLPGSSAAAGEGAATGLGGTGLLASQQAALSLSELPGAPLDTNLELEEAVCKVVRSVCSVHGAVQMSSTSLGLSHAALPRDAVRFLAPSGAQMALRYEVRYPLAAWFAQQAAMAAAVPYGMGAGAWAGGVAAHQQQVSTASALERGLKRFEVCRVNRAGRGGRGLPASYLQADFDVIVPAGTGASLREKMLAEAEVLKAATQVLEALPDLGPYELRLGHTQLFAAAIAGMCLPPEVTPASVMALLSSAISISAATPGGQGTAGTAGSAAGGGVQGLAAADKAHSTPHGTATASSSSSTGRASMWPAVRAGLDGLGLDAKPVSRCRLCTLKLPGPLTSQLAVLRSFLHELRPQLGSGGLAAALSAVDELAALGQLLVDWGLAAEHILLEPLLTPPSEYFGGVLFQVLLRMSPAQSGTMYTSAVAAGGRYDGLLKSLWSPAAATIMPAPGAVGVSINCEKLIRTLLQRGQHKGGHGYMQGAVGGLPGALGLQGGRLQTGQCDVLVCAKGGDGMLQLRMQLLSHLWSAGISAALLPREAPSLTEQYEYAHGSGARWLVILDDKSIGPSQLVRVKSLERKGEDASIHIADLGRFLQLGLSGTQDPTRSIASGLALLTPASGHRGGVVVQANGAGGGLGAAQGQGHRLLQRFASDNRLGSTGDSVDAEYDAASGREREGGVGRELQSGRHRDRRR